MDPTEEPENQEWAITAYWQAISGFVGDLATNLIMGKLRVGEVIEKIKGVAR